MLTNTDATVYSREYDSASRMDVWKRQYVKTAWWHTSEKSSVTTDGLKVADVVSIRIPDLSVQVKKDDYIVKGEGPEVIETVKDLDGYEKIKVTSVNYNHFGLNPHIKVGAGDGQR